MRFYETETITLWLYIL